MRNISGLAGVNGARAVKKCQKKGRNEKNQIFNLKQLLSFSTKGMQENFLYQYEINPYSAW